MFLLSDRKILRQLSRHTQVQPILRHSRLREDLGLDDLALANLMLDLEAMFDITISDAQSDEWKTVKELQFGIKRLSKYGE
jgi:acyl carrier protein